MKDFTYKEAKILLSKGDYSSVSDYFKQNDFTLEYAYCLLMSGDVSAAKNEFAKIADSDMRATWALKLIQFIEGYVSFAPSYFQIRNFLEIDLNLLLQARQPFFVENIINGADIFYSVNQESYKFISRVMLNNGFHDVALHFLLKAKDKFYYDPEMHLMLASVYLYKKEQKLAKKALDACLGMLPDYFPAKKLYEQLV